MKHSKDCKEAKINTIDNSNYKFENKDCEVNLDDNLANVTESNDNKND